MASELIVQTLKGPTSGANANKIIVPSDQTLTATGHIIQVKRSSIGGNITTTSSTPVASGLQCAFTPKFSSSLIQVQCLGGRSYVQSGQQLDISLFKDGSNVNTVGVGRWESHYSASGHHHGGYSACYFETAGSTSSRTYQVYFDTSSGTGYFTNSPSGNDEYLVHLVVTEIAQ